MARNNGGKQFLEMDARTKHKHLAAVHETVEALPGVDKGFGRNPVHVIGADGRKRAVCDLYVVLEDGRVFEVERVATSPSSIRRAVDGFRNVGGRRKERNRVLPPGREPKAVASEILSAIDPEYRISTWLPVGVNRYERYGNRYETAYCYHDLLQVTHPVLGLSPFVEFESLIRFDPPRDPFTELKKIIDAHRLVHETYEGRVSMCGFLVEKGRSSVQVVVSGNGANGRPRAVRLMQTVRAHARDGRRLSRRVPFVSSRLAGGVLVGLLDVELPGLGPAIKVSRTSRSNPRILKSFLERGYNFLVRGVLRYATFQDEKQAREFDRRVLEATAPWKIDVGPEIQGNTEFRDYYQLTRVDEAFRALQKELPKGLAATTGEPKTPKRAGPRQAVEKVDLALDEAFGDDEVVCLVCGTAFRTLARHLRTAHRLTAAQYRRRFRIPDATPLTSRKYSELRRTIASKRKTVAS